MGDSSLRCIAFGCALCLPTVKENKRAKNRVLRNIKKSDDTSSDGIGDGAGDEGILVREGAPGLGVAARKG